jgi:pimeloyl-ACP methyl ester carboxylesterase
VHEDRFVDAHDGIRIAVRDHHGDGPDLVLLHGAGSHLLSLFNLVRKLEDTFRVVTLDARWSGQSGDSDVYDWGDLVRDVEAVVAQVGLDNPAVAGHSWGGMIAAFYGAAHPEAPGVINLDGQGSGNRSLYDGITDEEYERAVTLLEQVNAAPLGGDEGDAAWYAQALVQARGMTELLGVPADLVDEWTARNFVEITPGRWRRHPSPTLFAGLRGDLQLFDLYRRVECPLQVFNCTAAGAPGIPPELDEVMQGYRRGLTRALHDLAEERANLDVVVLPQCTHTGVVAGGARTAADEMRRFLSRHA